MVIYLENSQVYTCPPPHRLLYVRVGMMGDLSKVDKEEECGEASRRVLTVGGGLLVYASS